MLFLDLSFWEEGIRGLMAMLCQVIYPIISFLYELFNNISKINILSQGEIEPIYMRITMILTIIMVFYVTFQFVKYVVQPDTMTDKEKGAGPIIYKMIAVVALIAFVPTIFKISYDFQNAIISKNVISKIMLGPQAITDEKEMGSSFSATVFNMFYYVNDENKTATCYDGMDCETLVNYNVSLLKDENSLVGITAGLNETNGTNNALINFDGILAVIVGGFIVYILALYCIDVGVRWVQLIYLQIIAPIPIIGFLSPKKDGMFQKWTKQCITTYLDLFLRVAIINIVLLLCDTILVSKVNADPEHNLLAGLGELSIMMETLIYIVLIMAVMMFAHKAPKLLGELFPKMGAASGNFGLSAKERYEPTMKALRVGGRFGGALAGTAIGAVVGAGSGLAQGWRRSKSLNKDGIAKGTGAGIWGATRGFVGGALGGAGRGLVNGGKKGNILKNATAGAKNQVQANQRFGNREENGYTFGHQIGDRARGILGAKSRTQVLEDAKAPIKSHDDTLKRVADTEANIKKRALEKIKEGGAKSSEAKAAARALASAEQELKSLEDPNVSKAKFKVGKYSNADEAQEAYDSALLLAKSSVNKANFMDSNGNLVDPDGYAKACEAAMKQVKVEDYAVAYKTEAEAEAAYQLKISQAKSKINRNLYSDQATYEAACQEASSKITKDLYIEGYETEAEAQKALGAAIDAARSNLDEKQKDAVAAYAKQTGTDADAAIGTMVADLKTYVTEYNNSSVSSRRVEVDYDGIISDFKTFSKDVKQGNIRKAIDKNSQETIKIDAEITKIKNETTGSGINEGKKS